MTGATPKVPFHPAQGTILMVLYRRLSFQRVAVSLRGRRDCRSMRSGRRENPVDLRCPRAARVIARRPHRQHPGTTGPGSDARPAAIMES